MQQVAKETGAAIALAYATRCEARGEADTYVKMIRHDVTTFIAA